jgi:hypothetical protein
VSEKIRPVAGDHEPETKDGFEQQPSSTEIAKTKQLRFHPLADIFPLMEGAEFDALVADIKANGQLEPIILHEGKILDGRNPYRACLAAGVEPMLHNAGKTIANATDAVAHIISANIHRRHLTAEQKRALITALIKAQPEKSDRQIAKQVKASHPTIAKARREAEATGNAFPVEKRVGADGKARKQPARKQAEPMKAERPGTKRWTKVQELRATLDSCQHRDQRQRDDIGRLAKKLRAAEIKIAGLESENEELKAERDQLRRSLAEAHAANLALIERLKVYVPVEELPATDGLDIPDFLLRAPKAIAL